MNGDNVLGDDICLLQKNIFNFSKSKKQYLEIIIIIQICMLVYEVLANKFIGKLCCTITYVYNKLRAQPT